jgi:adenylosuccinate synthase
MGRRGKGKIVDWLTESATGVVRYHGGHNAGHTLVIAGPQDGAAPHPVGRAASRTSASTSATASCFRPARCCRRSASSRRGREVRSRLKISPACPLVLPIHVALDQAREASMGDEKIGTTGRGIGPAYEDKIARRALRVQDLLDPDRFSAKLEALLEFHNFMLVNYYKRDPVHFAKTRDEALAQALELRPMVADVAGLLHQARERGESLLFEGAQARCSTSTTARIRTSRAATACPALRPPDRASARRCSITCSAS